MYGSLLCHSAPQPLQRFGQACYHRSVLRRIQHGALLSMYGLGAAKESEQKKELLQALMEKKNEPVVIVKEAPRAEENQANTTF